MAALTTRVCILDKKEVHKEIGGEFKFAGTLVVYQQGNDIYHALSTARSSALVEPITEHLTDKRLIPIAAYCPLFSSALTRAPEPLPRNTYVKRPSLISYDRFQQGPLPNGIADDILAEVRICEILQQSPHPNIARYIGCQLSADRISGICFVKYGITLMQAVNPRNFMKRKLSATRQGLGNYRQVVEDVKKGLEHVHSLGLVHNDLNPSNIVSDGNTWVIIDFGSCRYEGESLDGVGRTYEWFDDAVRTSLPKNDLDALHEIQIWLEGGPSEAFQFEE